MKCMVIKSCGDCPNSVLGQRPFSCRTTGVVITSEVRNGIAVCGPIPSSCPLPDIDSVQVDMAVELKRSSWSGLVPKDPTDVKAVRRHESPELLRKAGVQFEVKNGGAHLIVTGPRGFIDFWPGPGKWICRSGHVGGGGLDGLIEFVKL
jgi:hypothetical protein